MSNKRRIILFLPLIVFLGIGIFLYKGLFLNPEKLDSALGRKANPGFPTGKAGKPGRDGH